MENRRVSSRFDWELHQCVALKDAERLRRVLNDTPPPAAGSAGLPVDDSGRNALMWAAQDGHLGLVQAICTSPWGRLAARQADEYAQTALMWAANGNHLECVQVLAKVSDLHAVDEDGRTALARAQRVNHTAVVDCLSPLMGRPAAV